MALTAPGREPLSYARLWLQLEDTVEALNRMGLGRNDRVAIALSNGPEMAMAFLAVSACATSAPLNPAYRADEFDFYLADLNAKALIIQSATDSPALAVAKARGIPIIELWPILDGGAGSFSLTGDPRLCPAQSGFAQPGDVALVLHTSGTTSKPKIVPLTHTNIFASALSIKNTFALTGSDRCLNVMPLFHVHGLIGSVLSSLTAGGSIVCAPGFYAPRFFEWIEEFHPTWYTAVPTIHQAIMARSSSNREVIERCPLRFIRSCSSALPPKLMAELEGTFKVPVIESYGMTEAAHQMTSNPLPPGERKPGSVGVAAGSQVAIMDEAGNPLPPGQTGEIVICGANVLLGYENNSTAHQSAFINGWFRTGDQGFFDPDGYLFITGRLKEIINRGGEKISPREVDDVLTDHPAVAQAVTFPIPHPQLGEEVAAAVVLRENASATERGMRKYAATRLADFKVPRLVVFVDEIPKGSTGKLQRIGLAEKLGLTADGHELSERKAEFTAPRTALEEILTKMWIQVMGVEKIGIHDNFFQLGGDSILAAQLISLVSEQIHVELSLRDLFEEPTLAEMALIIEGHMIAKSHIPRRPKQGSLPPSFGQERLWFVDQLEPNRAVYNRPAAVRLKGPLNVEALERGLHEILARHEALRTTFSNVQGQLCQIISPPAPLHLAVVDLGHLSKLEQETQALRLVNEEARRPFDLIQGPLQRMTLVRLREDEHILVLVIHHVVFDGWSLGVLFHELALLYESFSEGKPSPLPELPIQYADFALWQRNYIQGEVLDTQLAYWAQQLGGNLPALRLPTDRPRPPIQTYHAGRHSLVLSKALTGALKALSRSEEVTPFMLLLTAFQTLLYRHTGQEDILVGSPIAGRTRSETEGLIGFFVNTLVMRADLSGNPSFRQLLGRVRKVAFEAYVHQDLPFEKLVEVLQPERTPGQMPLFQVMFQLRNIPRRELRLSGLEVEEFEFDRETESLDLSLDVVEKAEQLSCLFEYNRDLFDAATVIRMAGQFQNLLNSIVTDPEERISRLALLAEAERRQMLSEWNHTRTDYPRDRCIHELFERQVERTPEAVAVIFENQELTYGELNARANQLARYLRKMGVGPEALVGICLDRSLEMIVGILGILKAGGAYVPLDPAYPSERLSFILEDAGVSLVLTQEGQLKDLPNHETPMVCLDRDGEVISQQQTGNLDSGAKAENSSHVIYTSGSTGKPKGVVLEHRSTCTLIDWAVQTYTSEELAGVLASTSICFDLSVFEIFVPLSSGGAIILADNALRLPILLAAEKVTLINTVPSALTELIRIEGIPASVQTVNSAGESLQGALVQTISQQGTIKKVCNLYGPTEDTVYSTYSVVSNIPEESLTIGRPIANTQVYILDRHLQPVPVGVPGEIYIGGDGLARGYLKHPELTAEKFIPDPFSSEQGARLYQTGDQARYQPDGKIEFLGRLDHQVKIRGYRVELGEVEAVLRQHPSVGEAVVLAHLDMAGNRQLAAYVVASHDAPSSGEFRAFLKPKLPEYMIPSVFTLLQKLPLTPNGKVDRTALPIPDWTRFELEERYVAPNSYVEDAVANIWREVLGIARIGLDENFFNLGGHSLLAMRVLSIIRNRFQIEVPLRIMFENPTVYHLAKVIGEATNSGKNPASQPILPALRNERVPLSFAQQRLWFLDKLNPNSPLYNLTLIRHFNESLDAGILENSINEIVRRHEALRTTFTVLEDEPVQIISPELIVHLTGIDLRQLPAGERDAEAHRLATDEALRPFDLTRGPLFRAALLRLNDAENVVLLTMHHIISDGWSLEVMLRELNSIYHAFLRGAPPRLPELPIQYADYAVWQRAWLQGEVFEKELAYWRTQLRDAPALLELPIDRPRPALQTFRGARHYFAFTPALSGALRVLSQRQGTTLFMTLLAAFQVLLSCYTQQEDLVVGSVIAGRGRAEIEGLIGFFVNTLALRSDLSGDPTFRELLSRVKSVTLGAYEHQDLPFEKLVEALRPVRCFSYSPLIQVMFVLQNTPAQIETREFGSRESPTLSLEIKTGAKNDLTLLMTETEQGLIGELEYSTDIFFSETIARMAGHFRTLLERIVDDAEQRISLLRMAIEAESLQPLVQ